MKDMRAHCLNRIVSDILTTDSKDSEIAAMALNGYGALKDWSEEDLVHEAFSRLCHLGGSACTTDEEVRKFSVSLPTNDWCSNYLYS